MTALGTPSPFAYSHAAWMVNCDEKVLRAVGQVEAGPWGGFLNSGQPVILYERHVFDRLTSGRYRGVTVTIANRQYQLSDPVAGDYGPVSLQWDKLTAAEKLDRQAALKSCSWGLFQVMGLNYARCGFDSVEAFVSTMSEGVDEHLRSLVCFIRSDRELAHAMRNRVWAEVARLYNGPNYAVNKYDQKLADAYAAL